MGDRYKVVTDEEEEYVVGIFPNPADPHMCALMLPKPDHRIPYKTHKNPDHYDRVKGQIDNKSARKSTVMSWVDEPVRNELYKTASAERICIYS